MFCPWGFIYCSIFAPHLNLFTWWGHVSSSKELPTVGKCHKFTTMFSPAVFWHGNTDWILVNLCPPPLHPDSMSNQTPSCFVAKNRGLFVTKAAACCSFVLFPRCKSANAAVGFIFNGTKRLSLFKPRTVTFVVFLFPCPCCSSSLQRLHTRCSHCLLFALRISHQPCLPPSSVWTFFFPFSFQLHRLCSVWFLQGAY